MGGTGHQEQVTWADVCARRLARHALTVASTGSIADIVAAIVGAHAQVMTAAEVAIGLRGSGITRVDVSTALWRDRSLVKTFGPRGTVHLVPARDLPLWCGALGALPVHSGLPVTDRLDPDQRAAVLAAIDHALTGAELTADELDAAVQSQCGPWAGDLVVPAFSGYWPRWRQAIGAAATAGVLCFGPARGRRVTYTNPRDWLPDFRPAPAEPARRWLLHEYLRAYGPATAPQFAQWLAAPRGWTADLVAAEADALTAITVDGLAGWVNAGDDTFDAPPVVGVRLLPYFDPYVVGSHPRAQLFAGRAAERALSGGQAGPFPVLLIDGVISGVWHQRRAGRRLHVTVEPFRRVGAAQRAAIAVQAERVAAVLEAEVEFTIGPIAVGAHA